MICPVCFGVVLCCVCFNAFFPFFLLLYVVRRMKEITLFIYFPCRNSFVFFFVRSIGRWSNIEFFESHYQRRWTEKKVPMRWIQNPRRTACDAMRQMDDEEKMNWCVHAIVVWSRYVCVCVLTICPFGEIKWKITLFGLLGVFWMGHL